MEKILEFINQNSTDELKEVLDNSKRIVYKNGFDIIETQFLLAAIVITENSLGATLLNELNINFKYENIANNEIENISGDYKKIEFKYNENVEGVFTEATNEILFLNCYRNDVSPVLLSSEIMLLAILSKRHYGGYKDLCQNPNVTYAMIKEYIYKKYNIDNKVFLPFSDSCIEFYDLLHIGGSMFKYIPYNKEIIENICINGKIKYSLPTSLNDKFELTARIENPINWNDIINEKLVDTDAYDKGVDETLKHLPTTVGNYSKDFLEKMMKNKNIAKKILANDETKKIMNNFLEDIFNNFTPIIEDVNQNFINQNYAVLSLTTECLSGPMWCHYANNYNGIIIIFDVTHSYFYNKNHPLYKVMYLENLIKFGNLNMQYHITIEDVAFFQKKKDWEYESEWRIIKRVNDLELANGIYVDNIPNDAIFGIIFGLDVAEKDKKECFNLLQNNEKSKHIEFRNLEIDKENLNYKLTEYKP